MSTLSFGSCYWSTATATTEAAATPIKAAGTTTAMQLGSFTTTNNRLTYTGTATRTFEASFTGSSTKGGGGSTIAKYMIYKNGVAVPGAEIDRSKANTSDEGAMSVMCHVSLATTDYVELWVETDTGDDLTIEHGVLAARVLG